MPGSNQIVCDPRHFSALLVRGQFKVLQVGLLSLLMPASYRAEFTR
jgi:hypothetical protein